MSGTPSAQADNLNCPVCGAQTPNLTKVDSGMKLHLQEQGHPSVPDEVCSSCLKNFRKSISKGTQLRAKEEAKASLKQELWKNRISLIKQGKHFLSHNDLADAAISLEKYLKILEVVYGVDRSKFEPKLFHDRPKEITLLCSVFWDLMLIYDAHPKYKPKQEMMATKLADFLRFSPLYSNIIRKAEKEIRKANNPAAYKLLLKLCNVQASRCFIATASFYPTHPTVQELCLFRDNFLRTKIWGRHFIELYYFISPTLARVIDRSPLLRRYSRYMLLRITSLLRHFSLVDK